MSEWQDGMRDLEDEARTMGYSIKDSNLPDLTSSAAADLWFPVTDAFHVGLEWDRMAAECSFTAATDDPVFGYSEFSNEAGASSHVALLVGRWSPGATASAARPFVQGGAGYGWATMSFRSDDDAEGHGGAFAALGLAGVSLRVSRIRVEAGLGYRFHRVSVDYEDLQALPNDFYDVGPDFFRNTPQLRSFVEGREVDFSGGFVRLGGTFAF